MIPLHLTIEGIYSYQERQFIDFQNLTEAGLFGIFGAVGSGKSSILEAITFVLYGKTERLNNSDKRAYNMMNLKANRSYIEFDFLNFENKKFRASRDFRRNSKRFDDVKAPNVSLHELVAEKWQPTERRIEEIIGLSYDNFKRTIIIPQGQFKEFLELGAKDRTEMMKEIFNLQKFDLFYKTTSLNTENKTKLDQLEGELKGFEEITEENIEILQTSLMEENQKLTQVKEEFKTADETYQKLKLQKADYLELKEKENLFLKQKAEKESIEHLEKKIAQFERVYKIFNPILTEKKRIEKEVSALLLEADLQTQEIKKIEVKKHKNAQLQEALQEKFEKLEVSKTEENDCRTLLKINSFQAEIQKLAERSAKGKKLVQINLEQQKSLLDEVKTCQKAIEDLKPQKLDAAVLQNVWEWFSNDKNLKTAAEKQKEKVSALAAENLAVIDELHSFQINLESYQEDFDQELKKAAAEKEKWQDELHKMLVQEKLAHFSHTLKPGEPCMLCGSQEHPHILEFNDVQKDLEVLKENIAKSDERAKKILATFGSVEKIILRKKLGEKNIETEQKVLTDIEVAIKNHLKLFVWKDFSADDEEEFLKRRKASFEIEKKLEVQQNLLRQKQEQSNKCTEDLNRFQTAIEDLVREQTNKEGQMQTHISNLQILQWELHAVKTLAELEERLEELSAENKEVEEQHQNLSKDKEDLERQLALCKNSWSHISKRLESLQKELKDGEEHLTKTLAEHLFSSADDVNKIICQNLDVAAEREKIQKFKVEYSTLQNAIEVLKVKLSHFTLDEDAFKKAAETFSTAEKLKNELNNLVVKWQAELERVKKEFEKKSELIRKLTHLQLRADNLKIMLNLFKGAGFVQYVSSIFLRQLCDQANVRFHRMTRNQLSLQLNENNDFEIIDYLNEGRCRSVKTLSGGQAFQVSLSLALALAESVQSGAKAEKNFFFIDEGFGTQDQESVNIVFETLMGLQKENRIVGIISHVEELKEKIPRSLTILKDELRGSLIHNTVS